MNEDIIATVDWEHLSAAEKKRQLFEKQKRLLDTFLDHQTISQTQYDKSLGDLRMKMGISDPEEK